MVEVDSIIEMDMEKEDMEDVLVEDEVPKKKRNILHIYLFDLKIFIEI